MSLQQTILQKVTQKIYGIEYVAVEDVTDEHADHLPDNTSETHFNVTVVSDMFIDMSRLQRHRYLYKILDFELTHGVHALSLLLYTVKEYRYETRHANNKSRTLH